MRIIGAGLAGLLAANMLKRHNPVIYERQSSLPNNHSALLRFRSSIVGDTVGIPFKKVTMVKCASEWRNPVADALAYSHKCTGNYMSNRSITAGSVTADRYIAPLDLISQLAEGVSIQYGHSFFPEEADEGDLSLFPKENLSPKRMADPVISTIPMPMLMRLLKYDHSDVEFGSDGGINLRATILDCDAYVSVYCPDPNRPYSRISITGNELIVEIPRRTLEGMGHDKDVLFSWLVEASEQLGIRRSDIYKFDAYEQAYQKIQPIDDGVRKYFIAWATDNHNIFSLGRFATWKPNLLLDDLVGDVRLIERWIQRRSKYELAHHRIKGAA